MPIKCTFFLNRKTTSTFSCSGFIDLPAYSGREEGRDNPDAVTRVGVGPIPHGIYYLVDRQSGGLFGPALDWWSQHGFGTTDRTKWFTLWNPSTGDFTVINGIKRANFRLHPEGPNRRSEGCITVADTDGFERLQRFIHNSPPRMPVSGTDLLAYGMVAVE